MASHSRTRNIVHKSFETHLWSFKVLLSPFEAWKTQCWYIVIAWKRVKKVRLGVTCGTRAFLMFKSQFIMSDKNFFEMCHWWKRVSVDHYSRIHVSWPAQIILRRYKTFTVTLIFGLFNPPLQSKSSRRTHITGGLSTFLVGLTYSDRSLILG